MLHYTALPVMGGVEAIMGEHERLLRGRGHDVVVLAGRGDCWVVPELDSRHAEVEALAADLAAGTDVGARFRALQERVSGALQEPLRDRELVIAHNVMTMPFNLPLASALAAGRVPVIAWTHDVAWVNPRYEAYRRPAWPTSILHEPQPGVRYVAISATRQREMAATFGQPPAAYPVVPNGIDADAFLRIDPATRGLLEAAGVGAADPLLLVPFRVTPRKRLELALEAAAVLRKRHPRLALVIAGPLGAHSAENRRYAEALQSARSGLGLEGTAFFLHQLAAAGAPHPVTSRMIADLYQLADAVLLTSESEGFGLPVIEGALARVPVVCADIPVLHEAGGDEIWTFPAGATGVEVADVVEQALASPPARLRSSVLQTYKWDSVLDSIESLIEDVVGS